MTSIKPSLLTDYARLQEVFDLRVMAWQEYGQINFDKFPNGYYDNLDETGLHWIIEYDEQIIGSARLNILRHPDELPYPKTFMRVIEFSNLPFIFYSRLVIHPDYQGNNFSSLLDEVRISFIKKKTAIRNIIATAGLQRANKLKCYGFSVIDKVQSDDDYKSMDKNDTYIIQLKYE